MKKSTSNKLFLTGLTGVALTAVAGTGAAITASQSEQKTLNSFLAHELNANPGINYERGKYTLISKDRVQYRIYTPRGFGYIEPGEVWDYIDNPRFDMNNNSKFMKSVLKSPDAFLNLDIPDGIWIISRPITQDERRWILWDKVVRMDFSHMTDKTPKWVRIEETGMKMLKDLILGPRIKYLYSNSLANNPRLENVYGFNNSEITEIKANVFNGSNNLKTIDLTGSKVWKLNSNAFLGTSLTSFLAGDHLTQIDNNAFPSGMSKYNVNLPAKFNNAEDFNRMGLRKYDGSSYSSYDLQAEDINSTVFNAAEIGAFFDANKDLSPITLIDTWNNEFGGEKNLLKAARFLTPTVRVGQNDVVVNTRNVIKSIKAVINEVTNRPELTVEFNNLYTSTQPNTEIVTDPNKPTQPDQEHNGGNNQNNKPNPETEKQLNNIDLTVKVGLSVLGGILLITLIVAAIMFIIKRSKITKETY